MRITCMGSQEIYLSDGMTSLQPNPTKNNRIISDTIVSTPTTVTRSLTTASWIKVRMSKAYTIINKSLTRRPQLGIG
jgi:hypothetical protein